MQNIKTGKLIIFTGPSGVGKGTILKKFFNIVGNNNDNIIYSISSTTRKPRDGEKNGVDYFFITKEKFESEINDNLFLEWAKYSDNYYGTSRTFVEKNINKGISVLLEIELQGAMKIMNDYPESVSIFVMPPSFEELEHRLRGRNSEDNQTILKRLETAKIELKNADKFKYKIVNSDVDTAVKVLYEVILKEIK